MEEDDWTEAAMRDGSLVADLLVHLRRSPPPEKKKNRRSLSPPMLTWRVRQPRSRPVSGFKPAASPTTPLSWSCDTSASGGGGGGGGRFEDAATVVFSQVIDPSENTTSKRSRKKKTLAEVKEDEALVLKEREDLKKKLASLRVAVEIERATNERLKRFKLHYVSCSVRTVSLHVPAEQDLKMVSSYNPFTEDSSTNGSKIVEQSILNNCPKSHKEVTNRESKFKLPDLNLPIEDSAP